MSRVEWVEQVVIFVAIVSLWPVVFVRDLPWWYNYGLLALVLAAMVAILYRRWRRMNEAFDQAKRDISATGQSLPWGPPAPPPPNNGGRKSKGGNGRLR